MKKVLMDNVVSKKVKPHEGMPAFDEEGEALSFFEFWPMWAFYPPVFVYAFYLMLRYRGVLLPTVANPSFPGGGFVGESKADILKLAMQHIPDWTADFFAVERPVFKDEHELRLFKQDILQTMEGKGLVFPVVAKPDMGCRGVGVKLLRTETDLESYLQKFPAQASFLIQRFVNLEGEAGVFYCRLPGQSKGHLISLTLKYFPYVTGDGVRSLRQLILADKRAGQLTRLYFHRHLAKLDTIPAKGESIRLAFAGSHSRGTIFRNGTHLITPKMIERFDEISQQLPEFYFGRYDIRFADFSKVQEGEDFTIVEVNGAGAESTHIWDRKTTLFRAWKDLMIQYRWLFQIGFANRKRGFKTLSIKAFLAGYRREKELTPHYPATD
jgi:hypothetical protein